MIKHATRSALDRRAFLTATGALRGHAGRARGLRAEAAATAPRRGRRSRATSSPPTSPSMRTARCVAYYGKIDGGQGLDTSIAQMVAEEIDVPWEHVRVVMGDSALHRRHGRRQRRPSAFRTAA